MSEIRVDNITDEAGTGRPSFPNGIVPIGTTAERPSSPEAGEIRFNTDENEFEGYDGNDWGVIRSDEKQATVPIRQTVLFGPVDSAGRADFLEANSADLTISTTMLDVNPLKVTVALGFDPGPVNRTVSVESNQTWTSLVDNAVNYLGLRVDSDGTITPVHTTSLDYGYAHPSSPSTGDYSFLIPAMRMFRYDGAEWVTDPVVFIGQAETDSGAVVETRSYAYQGRWELIVSDLPTARGSASYATNIGAPFITQDVVGICQSSDRGYSPGERARIINRQDSGGDRQVPTPLVSKDVNNVQIVGTFTDYRVQEIGAGINTIDESKWIFELRAWRVF